MSVVAADRMELVRWDDPALLRPGERFNGSVDEARRVEAGMVEAMDRHRGLGLSACQVGLPWRAFALKVEPRAVVFNPHVVDMTQDGGWLEEGCLSFPGLLVDVWRPNVVKLRFQTSDGQMQTEKYSGMTARVVMHEMEHLAGRVFFDHLGRMALETRLRKAAKRGYSYPAGMMWKISQASNANGRR